MAYFLGHPVGIIGLLVNKLLYVQKVL